MNRKDVDSIAWLIKQAKDNNQSKPIVFLGAGASISAGIPGTAKIIEDILKNFANKPEVKKLDDDSRVNYYKIMSCLNTTERHKLLRDYITRSDVKINVTHIYLAQMLNEGYVDYVLTVNFDDLFLRACALFNFIPPIYDISILKDFTTTTLIERSVTYLHGQRHGFWLLNTGEELDKVKDYIRTVFDRICNNRTWIIVGYSGEDTVFDQIARLDNFTNELFWVGYNDFLPSKKVRSKLLEKPNSNASWISGYDADSFFLKLHSELKMDTPDIFNKPFSFLKGLMGNIKDIDERLTNGNHKILFESIKERYDVALKQTNASIKQYEESDPLGALSIEEINRDRLKKKIIETIVKENYEEGPKLLNEIDKKDNELKILISQLFYNWGVTFSELAKSKGSLPLFKKSIEKYKIAIDLHPKNALAYNNWGAVLFRMVLLFKKDALLTESQKKLEKAIEIDPKLGSAYSNLSGVLIACARKEPADKSHQLLREAEEIAKKAFELGKSAYNLSCIYSLLKQKDDALKYLKEALHTKDVTIKYVLSDKDWLEFMDDEDFKTLIKQYSADPIPTS